MVLFFSLAHFFSQHIFYHCHCPNYAPGTHIPVTRATPTKTLKLSMSIRTRGLPSNAILLCKRELRLNMAAHSHGFFTSLSSMAFTTAN